MELQPSRRRSQPRRFVYRDAAPISVEAHPLRRATDRHRQLYVVDARSTQPAIVLQFRVFPPEN